MQGNTTTAALSDSLPSIIKSARIIQEYKGVMSQLATRERLGDGIGNDWNEVSLSKLNAQVVTETTELDNPQQIVDSLLTVTPTMVGMHTFVSDRVAHRISKNVVAKIGGLAQNAMQRRKDLDGLAQLDAATNSLSGAGTTLVSGVIAAAVYRCASNSTEPMPPPYRVVLQGFQIKDIDDEVTAPVGTYPLGEGLTANVFRERFQGMIHGAQLYLDDNITVDSSDDAKGGVFAQYALLLIEGRSPWSFVKHEPQRGGGGNSLFLYDEYAWGERGGGIGVYEVYSDATTPTT